MNAIEQELTILAQQWDEFIVGEQPILHWLIKSADSLLVNTFVKVKEQFEEDTGSWFIQLTCPFVSSETFGFHLAAEFNQLIAGGLEEADEEEAEAEIAAQASSVEPWQAYDISQAQSGFHALIASINSVLELFATNIEQLTLVINPVEIKQQSGFEQWWEQACLLGVNVASWPAKLKFLAIDNFTQPILTDVLAKYPYAALSQTPPINLNAAAKAVAEQTHDGSDAARLRLLFLEMNSAITDQDKNALNDSCEQALIITQNNQWPDMTTTALLIRGGGLLNFKQFTLAVKDYQQAQLFAAIGIENKIPGCDKLLLQALLFEGTAYFLGNQLEPAAKAYEAAAVKACEFEDFWIALEAWRMAAFVSERLNQTTAAWQFATAALEIGKKMAEEERQHTTLGFVGQAMLRLSNNQQAKNEINTVFSELLGNDWLKTLESAVA